MLTRKIVSFIALISFIGFISGCKSNEAPKCSDPEVIATAKKISGDLVLEGEKHGEQLKKFKQEYYSVIDYSVLAYLESKGQKNYPLFMNLTFKKRGEELKNLRIESIRTLSTNKETGSHVCAGQLVYENNEGRVATNILYTSEKLEDSNDFYVTVRF